LTAARSARAAARVTGDAIAGARIYDNWMLALDQPLPTGNHPLWASQETNIRNGVSTWRCVECHGWDYEGELGAYGPYSSHYTGFPGVDGMVGATQDEILNWLNGTNNPQHNFLALTNSTAIQDLVAFLRTQQVDMDLLVDPFTGASLGDRNLGQALYITDCSSCHGTAGDRINLGSTANPIYLADLATVDPWQTIHKIRFGTPTNLRMPSSEAEGWSLSEVANVLAYVQGLRRGDPALTFVNTASSGPVQIERQGEIGPILWMAVVMFTLIAGTFVWDKIQFRSAAAKSSKKK
jgi:thiosulfate dehydrogenase